MKTCILLLIIISGSDLYAQTALMKVKLRIDKQLQSCGYKMDPWESDERIAEDHKLVAYRFYQLKSGVSYTDSVLPLRQYAMVYKNTKDTFGSKEMLNTFDNPKTMIFIYKAATPELARQIDSSFSATKEWYITEGHKEKEGYTFFDDKSIDHIHLAYDTYIIYLLNFKAIVCNDFVNGLFQMEGAE